MVSGTLPPRLTSAEKARLKEAHLPFAVGVEGKNAPLVIKRLRKTNLFTAVDYVHRLPEPPAVLAQWEQTPYGTATIPIGTFLTCGIIPTTVREPLSFGCTFYSPHHPGQRVRVEYRYDSRTTVGWVAALLALSPSVVMFPGPPPDEHRRFNQHLSLAILDRSNEIRKLTEE